MAGDIVTGTVTASANVTTVDFFSTGNNVIGNTTFQIFANSTLWKLFNSSVNTQIAATGVSVGANVSLGLSSLTVGNSSVNAQINSTSIYLYSNTANKVPVGNTGNRPAAAYGLFRYNVDTPGFEGANGTVWSQIGGGTGLTANSTDPQTFYLPMSNASTGTWSNAVVATSVLYFVPSTGTLSATTFNALSDEDTKKDIEVIQSALGIIEGLRGVRFKWKNNNEPSAGLIAQEVEAFLPELVTQNNGQKSLNYSGVIGVLVEAVKELSLRVKALENG